LDKHLHIISFDVPYPADYGGVIDVYYRIKSLHEFGIKIHLHCFKKYREEQPMLEKYCVSVNYYDRKKNLAGFSRKLPYIVQSRSSSELIENLKKDNYPILAEGIHCTYFLQTNDFAHRKTFIRLHNAEHRYYAQLAAHESNLLKKYYFNHEAKLLKKYEAAIANKAHILALSMEDATLYQQLFHAEHTQFLPVSLPWDEPASKPGKGAYCLYHGNLAVNENEKAAAWLISHVFKNSEIPFIIAGHAPSAKLRRLAAKSKNIQLIADPEEAAMQKLIEDAQINVLPSFNKTGVKLKLLNALFNGRHCIVNTAGTEGSGLDGLCYIAESADDFKKKIMKLFTQPFTEKEMQHRSAALKKLYSNEQNARHLNAWLY
jgi:glycosyltransferase involved in cell wall biosynthesis